MSRPYFTSAIGRRVYLPNPRLDTSTPLTTLISEIVGGLSAVKRFSSRSRWSVAQHSILVHHAVQQCPRVIRLEALLHDASEAYLGDMPAPLKEFLPDYVALEDNFQQQIFAAFGIPFRGPRYVKSPAVADADAAAMSVEKSYDAVPHQHAYPEPECSADTRDDLRNWTTKVRFDLWSPDYAAAEFRAHLSATLTT